MALRMVSLKSSKTGEWIARKGIPADVRAEYKRLYGVGREAILRVPAGTSKAQAKAQLGQWQAEVETQIERIRGAAKGEGEPLTKLNALGLSGRWYAWFIARHESDPGSPENWADRKEHLTERVWYPHAPAEHLENPNADTSWPWTRWPEVRAAVRPEVAEMALAATFLASEGRALTHDANALFVDAVSERLFSAYAVLEQRANGDYSRDTYPDTFPAYVDQRRGASTSMSCWDLFGAYVESKKPKPKTIERLRGVFLHLNDVFADKSAASMSEAEARMWAQKLVTAKRGSLTVSNVWITGANIVFSWALKHKHIQANPFADVEVDVPKKITLRETPAFTPLEARTILRAALQIQNMATAMMRAKRWALWLCAYSGARAGEIVQLRGKDITKRGKFYVMRLTPEAGTIKTGNARIVPIHEHIVAQGFIEFVKAHGNGPMFYNARAASDAKPDPLNPKPHPSDKTRQRLGAWVRALGVDDPEVLPTHGWRHTFKQTADRVGITEKVSHAITGHAPTNIGQSYGAPTVEDMAKALKKFPRYAV